MKEASGEASLTVVAIILIAAIAAVVTPIITSMMNTTKLKACCMDAGGTLKGNACEGGDDTTYQACVKGSEDK